jgi:hypothetical protein
MKALIILATALVALCSCHSPLEIDTPRDKTYDSIPDPGTHHTTTPPPHAVARQVTVAFSGDNSITIVDYTSAWTLAEIDTSGAVPAVWLNGTCTPTVPGSISLQSLGLRIDSMAANGTMVGIIGPPDNGQGARIEMGDGFVANKVFIPNGSGTKLDMQIAKTGTARLEGTIQINALYNNRATQLNGTIAIDY